MMRQYGAVLKRQIQARQFTYINLHTVETETKTSVRIQMIQKDRIIVTS